MELSIFLLQFYSVQQLIPWTRQHLHNPSLYLIFSTVCETPLPSILFDPSRVLLCHFHFTHPTLKEPLRKRLIVQWRLWRNM
ncbi:hypothetical protein K1719_043993 [Acacia pycnantha]|nr:hypothetical protein K1719_043993 [Acacia pycnantha]